MKWTEPPGYSPDKWEFDETEDCYDQIGAGWRWLGYFACAVILIVAGFAVAAAL